MLVSSRMKKNPVTVSPTDRLADAETRMNSGNFRHLPVVQDGKLVGMLSDADLRAHQGHLGETRVNAVMVTDAFTVAPEAPLEQAAEVLLERKIGGLPVVKDGALVGIITTTDILSAFVELLGVAEENTRRLDVLLDPTGEYDLAHAVDAIQNSGGEVLGLGTYRQNWGEQRIFYLVLRAEQTQKVADELGTKGFQVLGVY